MIILTYYNDFYDIMRTSHSGRAKPYFKLIDGNILKEHKPNITWKEKLRDKSYLFAKILYLKELHRVFTEEDISKAAKLYKALVARELENLAREKVHVIIAYHGMNKIEDDEIRSIFEKTINEFRAMPQFSVLALDSYLLDSFNFLKDGHWNKKGHHKIAHVLLNSISKIIDQSHQDISN